MVCERTSRESLGILFLLVHHSSELLRVFSQLGSIAFKLVEFSSPLLSVWTILSTYESTIHGNGSQSCVDLGDLDLKLVSSLEIVDLMSMADLDGHLRALLRIMTLATCSPTVN